MRCDSSCFIRVTEINVSAQFLWLEMEDRTDQYASGSYEGALVVQNYPNIQRPGSVLQS